MNNGSHLGGASAVGTAAIPTLLTTTATTSEDKKHEIAASIELLRQEDECWKKGQYRRCVEISTQLLERSPGNAKLLVRRARANLELSRAALVDRDARAAISIEPDNLRAHLLVGYANLILAATILREETCAESELAEAMALLSEAKEELGGDRVCSPLDSFAPSGELD